MDKKYEGQKNSAMQWHELYFWTATIKDWKWLLLDDTMKREIIQSLQWLIERKLISVYAYVIMPNHIHLIWELHAPNGRESAKGSLLKFTAHRFRTMLYQQNPVLLKSYEVEAANKKHEFWKSGPLAIRLYSLAVINQKIDYIHNNPVSGRWQLAPTADDYRFSSAGFYQNGVDEFGILTHIGSVFHSEQAAS